MRHPRRPDGSVVALATAAFAATLLALWVLLAGRAYAQVIEPGAGGPYAQTSSSVKARYPFTKLGEVIPNQPPGFTTSATMHLVWNGTALVDMAESPVPKTTNGTIPQVTPGPWYPSGFTASPKPGAGPFSGSNYYDLVSGNTPTVTDMTGDFVICAVLDGNPATGANQRIVADYVAATSGWHLFLSTAGIATQRFESPAAVSSVSGAALVNGLNVVCGGRASTTGWVKANLQAADTDALPAQVGATSTVGRIGLDTDGNEQLTMTLRELIIWNAETPTDAKLTAVQRHVFGMCGTKGCVAEPVSITRTTGATVELPDEGGTVYQVPAAVTRTNAKGLLVEPARTNYLQYSSQSCTGTAVQAPWTLAGSPTCTDDDQQGPWAFESTSMDTWTSVVNTDRVYQSATLASTATAVGSVWAAKPSGTGTVEVWTECTGGTASTCSCITSSGVACSTAPVGAVCVGTVATLSTTPTRISLTATCSAATTSWRMYLAPGDYAVSTGTARFGGAQLEVGSYVSSYIPTPSGASVARNADAVSVANALQAANPPNWCVGGTYTPEHGRAWGGFSGNETFWALGSAGAANTARLMAGNATTLSHYVYDAASGVRQLDRVHGFTGSSPKTLVGCGTGGATLRVVTDGTAVSGGSGAGSGVITTQPASVYVGSSSAASREIGGYLRNFRLCNRGTPGTCK